MPDDPNGEPREYSIPRGVHEEVYRLQGVTEFLVDEQVDKFRFMEENERVIGNGGHPAKAQIGRASCRERV